MITASNPESIEQMLYAYGCSCNHRNLDNAVANINNGVVTIRVGHTLYKCTFDNQDSRVLFSMSLADAGVDVVIWRTN